MATKIVDHTFSTKRNRGPRKMIRDEWLEGIWRAEKMSEDENGVVTGDFENGKNFIAALRREARSDRFKTEKTPHGVLLGWDDERDENGEIIAVNFEFTSVAAPEPYGPRAPKDDTPEETSPRKGRTLTKV